MKSGAIPSGQALRLDDLIAATEGGIASRVLAKTNGGSVTLFAFDGGEGLSEHTTPYDALVVTLAGALEITIADARTTTLPGTIILLPANVQHAVRAVEASRMLLTMLK